jgi:hypothetical protein
MNNSFSYIIEGQSNANGAALNATVPPDLTGVIKDAFINMLGDWQGLQVGVNTRPFIATQGFFGVELRLMKLLADYYGSPQFLYKFAVGGTSLYNNGNDGSCWDSTLPSRLYDMSNAYYSKGLASIPVKAPLKCYIWIQGENDASVLAAANLYLANMKKFIANKRAYYGEPTLPFIIVRLSNMQTAYTYKTTIQAAQDRLALEDPNVYTINTDTKELQAGDIHYTAMGYDAIATDIFNRIILL